MIKRVLNLIGGKPNIFTLPQATIDTYKIDDEDKELFLSTVKVFSNRAKSHLTYPYIKLHLDSGLSAFDVVRIPKYPLPVVFNETTRKVIINLPPTGHRSVTGLEPRDLYALLMMGHSVGKLSSAKISTTDSIPFIEFMSAIYLKIFSKKYGLSGSYSKLIPEIRYFVSVYVLVSFFDMSQKDALDRATITSKYDRKDLNVDMNAYDFSSILDLVKVLNDSGVLPGLNLYRFISTMMNIFEMYNLPLLEDSMRFGSSLMVASINGNTLVPSFVQSYNQEAYQRIVTSIQKAI